MERFPAPTTSDDLLRTDNLFAPAPSETVAQADLQQPSTIDGPRRPSSLEDTLTGEQQGLVWTPDGPISITLGHTDAPTVPMHVIKEGRADSYVARHSRKPERSPWRERVLYAAASVAVVGVLSVGTNALNGLNKKPEVAAEAVLPGVSEPDKHLTTPSPQTTGDTVKTPPKPPTRAEKIKHMREKIAQFALPKYRPRGTKGAKALRGAYVKALDKPGSYTGGSGGVDCGAFVTAVMRESGADPNYNQNNGNTYSQLRYLQRHDDVNVQKGEKVLYHRLSAKEVAHLQPGDIAIRSHGPGTVGHTLLYVGPDQPGIDTKGKPTDFVGSYASSSLGSRAPMASPSIGSRSSFTWFRLR